MSVILLIFPPNFSNIQDNVGADVCLSTGIPSQLTTGWSVNNCIAYEPFEDKDSILQTTIFPVPCTGPGKQLVLNSGCRVAPADCLYEGLVTPVVSEAEIVFVPTKFTV